jgi:hypothetical protein
MGLRRVGVGVERCDILGAEYLGGTLGVIGETHATAQRR